MLPIRAVPHFVRLHRILRKRRKVILRIRRLR